MRGATRSTIALLSVLPIALTACTAASGDGATETGDDGALEVVATTSILGDLVGALVADAGTVTVLIGPGVDPHAFEPSPQQAQQARRADLVVANGLGLEEGLLDLLDAAAREGAAVLEVAPLLDPIPYTDAGPGGDDPDEGHADDAEDDGHAHGPGDPHVWLDPLRMADGVELIAEELAAADSTLDDAEWEQRGRQLAAELTELDEELRAVLAAVPDSRRALVTNHEALGYLAARYDFEILGAVVPGGSTQAEPNPRQLAELAATIEQADVGAIFAEAMDSTRLAEALRQEVGSEVDIVRLHTDALGEPGSGAETYADLMRTNARLMAQALTG